MPLGDVCAQLTHAAGESARLSDLPAGTHAVVLGVDSEHALLKLEAELQELDVPHAAIREPDAPYLGALTAIGIAPLAPHQLTGGARRILRRLPLLKSLL